MKITTKFEQFICKTVTACGQSKEIGIYALASVANELAASGASGLSVDVHIMVPSYAHKSRMNPMKKRIEKAAAEQNITVSEVRMEQTPAVDCPTVLVTGAGCIPAEELHPTETGRPGQEIVLTKWVGLEGMLRIADEREAEIQNRFAPAFVKQIQSYRREVFARTEIDVAKSMDVSAIQQITEGGILAALWELAKRSGCGLDLDMKRISILQETVEVCEQYRLNPYQLTSAGSFLMLTDRGEALADALLQAGIQASVLGCLTDNNDKLLRSGEEIRYIDRPAPDEIMKIMKAGSG